MVLLSDDLMDLFVSIIYSYFGLVTLVTDDFFFYGYRCSGGHRVGESEGILKASYTFNWEALLVIICLLVPCDLMCFSHFPWFCIKILHTYKRYCEDLCDSRGL